MQQQELFQRLEATIDKYLAAILRECEQYTGATARYALETLCEEIKSAPAEMFLTFFGNIEEEDTPGGTTTANFFAFLGAAAHSAALPRLKSTLINIIQEEFSFYE
jgi:hypothetical protein